MSVDGLQIQTARGASEGKGQIQLVHCVYEWRALIPSTSQWYTTGTEHASSGSIVYAGALRWRQCTVSSQSQLDRCRLQVVYAARCVLIKFASLACFGWEFQHALKLLVGMQTSNSRMRGPCEPAGQVCGGASTWPSLAGWVGEEEEQLRWPMEAEKR